MECLAGWVHSLQLLVAGFGGLHLYNKIKDAMGAGFGRRFVLVWMETRTLLEGGLAPSSAALLRAQNHPQIRAVIGGRPR